MKRLLPGNRGDEPRPCSPYEPAASSQGEMMPLFAPPKAFARSRKQTDRNSERNLDASSASGVPKNPGIRQPPSGHLQYSRNDCVGKGLWHEKSRAYEHRAYGQHSGNGVEASQSKELDG